MTLNGQRKTGVYDHFYHIHLRHEYAKFSFEQSSDIIVQEKLIMWASISRVLTYSIDPYNKVSNIYLVRFNCIITLKTA